MRVALVWPHGFDPLYAFPLSLAYLKANLDSTRHEVTIIDCALDSIAHDNPRLARELTAFRPEVVGVSCWAHTYDEALAVLKLTKRLLPQAVTVMGGPQATTRATTALEQQAVDFVFRGEAEQAFGQFLDRLSDRSAGFGDIPGLCFRKQDGSHHIAEPSLIRQLDALHVPDYGAAGIENYFSAGYRYNTRHRRNAPIWYTRGCPYRCGFCSAPVLNGQPIRAHSIDYMLDWILRLYRQHGVRCFNLIDDNFTFDLRLAKQFCRAVIALGLPGLRFSTPNGIRVQKTDRELLDLMKQAGWENVCIAPESGSARTLKRMKKDLDPGIIPAKVREIKEAGLKVHAFFVIGYPGDTREDVADTVRLLRSCKFDFIFINNFQPLPGTPIHEELVELGEIPAGLAPKGFSDGERVYIPPGLRGFNFAAFVLKEYCMLALTNPRTIPYMFRLISPAMAAKKVWANLKRSLMSLAANA